MEDWLEPCLDAEEMRATDRWAIQDRGVPSLQLMETAGRAVAEVAAEVARSSRAAVVCGKGNNGRQGQPRAVRGRAARRRGRDWLGDPRCRRSRGCDLRHRLRGDPA